MLFKDSGRLENNTIAFDTTASGSGGGIAFEVTSGTCQNNIICRNSSYGICSYGVSPSLSYNDVWGNTQGSYSGINAGTGSISADPLFVGGSPYDFHLMTDSPCIDAGNPASPQDPNNTRADMGAYPYGAYYHGLTFKISDVFGTNGQIINVPVMVFGFNGHPIGGLELHIAFNQSGLVFDSLVTDYLSGAEINIQDSQIHLIWDDYTAPLVLQDSTILLTLQFTITGGLGSTYPITWLPGCSAVNPSGDPYYGANFGPGGVQVVVFQQICGHVAYYDSLRPVPDVNINLSGRSVGSVTSNPNGLFCFDSLINGNYTLRPALNTNAEGVTISDVIKIRRHIIRLETLDSPYKYVAADVDRSGNISVSDAVKIRRYLAGIDSFPSGNWVFIDSAFAINSTNWPTAPRNVGVLLGSEDISNIGFIGVRMGDVDGSWMAGDLLWISPSDTTALLLGTASGEVGDTIVIPLTCHGASGVAGLEMHLTYSQAALSFIGIESEVLSNPTFNGGSGAIDFVWDDIDNPITVPDGEVLATIKFRIESGAPDQSLVSFASAHVADGTGAEFGHILQGGAVYREMTGTGGRETNLPSEFMLCQNFPNPFNPTTTIKYGLPISSKVTIEIYDLLGRQIESIDRGLEEAGFHQVVWDGSSVPSGIYFYKIKVGNAVQTKPMLLLK